MAFESVGGRFGMRARCFMPVDNRSKTPHYLRCAELVGCLVNTSYDVGRKVPATLGSTTRERGEGFKIPGWPVNSRRRASVRSLHAKFGVGM